MNVAYADITDLEQLIVELQNKPVSAFPPKMPEFKPESTNFTPFGSLDFFSQDLLEESNTTTNYLLKYNLNQIQMVGYMKYRNINYAFLKTPYETLKVKVGDKIQKGVVNKIDTNLIEIVEQQEFNNKIFDKKIFIKLEEPKNNKSIKLPIK